MSREYRVIKDYYENGVKYFYIEEKRWYFWHRLVDEIDDTNVNDITDSLHREYSNLSEAISVARKLSERKIDEPSQVMWTSTGPY